MKQLFFDSGDRWFLRKIISLGIPLLAGNFSQYLMQIADTAMVGRLGTVQLASIAMAGLYCHILHTFIWPLTTGTMAIAARRYGRQVYAENSSSMSAEHTGKVLNSGLVCAFCAVTAAISISFFSDFFLSFLTDSPDIAKNALEYIHTVRWMFVFAGFSAVVTGFLSAVNRTAPVMIVNIAANVLNIVFNYIFIFGKFGFTAMGIRGAALGTLLAEGAGAFYLLFVLLSDRSIESYRLLKFSGARLPLVLDIFRSAFPIAVQNIIALSVFLVYESIVGSIATVFLASIHIVFSVFRINKTIVGGFARAGAILAGNFLGAGQKEKAEKTVLLCGIAGVIIGVVILSAVLFMPEFIAGIFTDEQATIQAAVEAIRFFSFFFFIEVVGYTFEIIFSGIGWSRFVLYSEFTTNMVFILAMTWICIKVLAMPLVWAWISFALYQTGHAVILICGWRSKRWLDIMVESGN